MSDELFYRVVALQGKDLDDCFVLVETSPYEDFKDREMLAWALVHVRSGFCSVVASDAGRADGLWVSPSGRGYFIGIVDGVFGLHIRHLREKNASWEYQADVQRPPTVVSSVWGLSDERVFAWGGGVIDSLSYPDPAHRPLNDDPLFWMKEGDGWREFPFVGWGYGIHGRNDHELYAVGQNQLFARWNGASWKKEPLPPPTDMSFIRVLPSGEVCAASCYGKVFQWSVSSWKQIGNDLGMICGIDVWKENLFVLASHGLFQREGDGLSLLQKTLNAKAIHAGEALLFLDEEALYERRGEGVRSIPVSSIFEVVSNRIDVS